MIDSRPFRSVMPAAAVVATALLAAFVQFTLPRMERLNALRAEYKGLNEKAMEIKPPPATPTGPQGSEVAQLVERVQVVNAAVAEPTSAYDRLVDLARRSGLQVESITPSRSETESGRIELFGWAMVATGEFKTIIEFVDALSAAPGLHRIASMRLTPAMGGDSTGLTLNLSVEFVRVIVPDLLLPDAHRKEPLATKEATP